MFKKKTYPQFGGKSVKIVLAEKYNESSVFFLYKTTEKNILYKTHIHAELKNSIIY